MFENLTERLSKTLRNISGRGRLTEDNIKDTLREVRMALLEADVALPVVKEFVSRVKERAVGQEVNKSLSPGQAFIKIVQGELIAVMGEANESLDLATQPPAVILMAGLQGAGKTTSVAKLAKYLKERLKKKVLVVSADVYRPAAIKQLQTLAADIGVEFFPSTAEQKPVAIAEAAITHARKQFFDVLIVDTAGRLHNKVNLMNELTKIKKVMERVVPDAPHEILLVLDGSTGQNAFEQAKQFTQATEVNALAITKLDGTAKGGVVIGVSNEFNIPVKYIGVGEGINDLQLFNRIDFVDSLFKE